MSVSLMFAAVTVTWKMCATSLLLNSIFFFTMAIGKGLGPTVPYSTTRTLKAKVSTSLLRLLQSDYF